MGTEAQKLITVSLEKIANFRRRRREMSLHKNLLVSTVIHKARIAIMEETYYMYAAAAAATTAAAAESGATDVYPSSPYVAATSDYAPPPPTYGCPQGGQVAVALSSDPLRTSDETNMDWESVRAPGDGGDEAAATPLRYEDDDKENLTPRLCRSPPPRGSKRHRTGTADDEASPQKRIKWEAAPMEQDEVSAAAEEHQLLLEEDEEEEEEEDDDTSHALRLVSVLMTGGATATTSSSSSSTGCGMAALRLVRSFSNPDLVLCSKQAKEGCKEMRTMMDSCCANRTPLAIAV